jgi:DNA uptake protein ComE-like DNA-binding protein
LEILAHDIKAGAGINALAGIRGYTEATPIIGYREKPAVEGEDKKGEFFIRGDLEIAAQPFLGLGGDLFVEIDAPWWSPVPDKRWTWPLGNKEWPIGGSFGIGASVDYVFGSGQAPAVDFKPVDFSADKFLTDLYSDKAEAKSGKRPDEPGKWNEKNAKAAETPPMDGKKGDAKVGKAPEPPPAKPLVKPGGPKKAKRPVDPKARTAEGKTVKDYQKEAARKGKKPDIKGPEKGTAKEEATVKDEAKKAHDEQLKKGLAALDAVTKRYAETGATKEEVIGGVKAVRRKFKVFKSISVVDGGDTWDYDYVAESGKKKGAKKAKGADVNQKALETMVPRQDPDFDTTDSLGRAKGPFGHVKGVKSKEGREVLPAVKELPGGKKAYQPGDHRGHLIGDRFKAPPTPANLVPMHPTLNLSTFKRFENAAAAMYLNYRKSRPAKPALLYMRVIPNYPKNDREDPASYRPKSVSASGKVTTIEKTDTKITKKEDSVPGGGTLPNPDSDIQRQDPVNLNEDPAKKIETLPGMTALLSKRIVAERKKGDFHTYKSLMERVSGIGEKTIERLRREDPYRPVRLRSY